MHPDRVIAFRTNKTIYRDGAQCIKAFGPRYADVDVFKEAYRQTLVHSLGLPVPAVYGIREINGRLAILSEYIKGHSLEKLLEMCPEKATEYVGLLATLQLEFEQTENGDLPRAVDIVRDILPLSGLDGSICEYISELLVKLPEGRALCHMDFTPGNVLVAESGEHYVVDWSYAVLGNPCLDAAATYLRMLYQYPELSDLYLKIYCEKSGKNKDEILCFVPIVAATRMLKGNSATTTDERNFLLEVLHKGDGLK